VCLPSLLFLVESIAGLFDVQVPIRLGYRFPESGSARCEAYSESPIKRSQCRSDLLNCWHADNYARVIWSATVVRTVEVAVSISGKEMSFCEHSRQALCGVRQVQFVGIFFVEPTRDWMHYIHARRENIVFIPFHVPFIPHRFHGV